MVSAPPAVSSNIECYQPLAKSSNARPLPSPKYSLFSSLHVVPKSKLLGDLKTFVSEIAPHPVLGLSIVVATRDMEVCEDRLKHGHVMCGHSSYDDTLAPCIFWLVAPDVYGEGICVSNELVYVPDTRTGWDVDHTAQVRTRGDLDIIVRKRGRHCKRWLWDSR